MKYAQLLATLTGQPLLIEPLFASSLLTLFNEHRSLSAAEFQARREGTGMCGEAIELQQAEQEDGVLFIPVGGPIGRGLGSFEKGAGAVDVDDITEELDTGEDDPNCRAAIMIFDCPGGMYNGTPELADRIEQFNKPIYAYVPGECDSAAIWLAASCDATFATKSADIGCIGVYSYWLDQTKRFEMEGLKAKLFTDGIYKGMGAPGIPLTAAQEQLLQRHVAGLSENFRQHIKTMRPDVKREDMEGQSFTAPEALEKGLIDGIVKSLDEVVALLR